MREFRPEAVSEISSFAMHQVQVFILPNQGPLEPMNSIAFE